MLCTTYERLFFVFYFVLGSWYLLVSRHFQLCLIDFLFFFWHSISFYFYSSSPSSSPFYTLPYPFYSTLLLTFLLFLGFFSAFGFGFTIHYSLFTIFCTTLKFLFQLRFLSHNHLFFSFFKYMYRPLSPPLFLSHL